VPAPPPVRSANTATALAPDNSSISTNPVPRPRFHNGGDPHGERIEHITSRRNEERIGRITLGGDRTPISGLYRAATQVFRTVVRQALSLNPMYTILANPSPRVVKQLARPCGRLCGMTTETIASVIT
jgi:hypothetical protein